MQQNLTIAGGVIALAFVTGTATFLAGAVPALLAAAPPPPVVAPAATPATETPVAEAPVDDAAPRALRMIDPAPLTAQIQRGLAWLVGHQNEDGGWGAGEESEHMRHGGGQKPAQVSDVGDTCTATLALIRAGHTPADGSYAESVRRGIEFILVSIEASDAESLAITDIQGTRLQGKLGANVDTFLAALVLPEVKGQMPDDDAETRLATALAKVLHKIEVNQQDDGQWRTGGWAPALARSVAVKGMNRAGQAGFVVNRKVLARSATRASGAVGGGSAFGDPGAAGVALYAGAANLAELQDTVNSGRQNEDDLRDAAENAPTATEREQAKKELADLDEAKAACSQMQQSIINRLDDDQFVAGFGSNGGEEFLSYLNIGESLVLKGGADWEKWEDRIAKNLDRIQNQDGSWTGHHCITGKTFCTSTALLVLMVDRTPFPEEVLARATTGDDVAE